MTIAHSTLTGAALHEPKGVASATANTVYIANGAGTGAWSSGSVLLGFTGMVADFATPIAPSGWLECDGSAVSRTTYADLFSAVSIQQSGTRTSGTKIITGLSSTTNMRAGFVVGGTGIVAGSVIATVDTATQITLDQNATSSGTSTVVVSPWAQGDGSTTFTLPDSKKRYRRGRDTANSIQMGAAQADQNKSHTHAASTTGTAPGHTHGVNITSATQSANHTHPFNAPGINGFYAASETTAPGNVQGWVNGPTGTGVESATHTHQVIGTSDASGALTLSASTAITATAAGTPDESRPLSNVVMTCIKT